MKKILTRLSSVLLLVTIVISAISMSGHVFAQTDRQNQNNIVDVETDENQNRKVTLQSSEESLEPTTGKTADSEQTETSGIPTGIHDITGTEVMMIIGFIGLVLIALYSYSKYKDMRG